MKSTAHADTAMCVSKFAASLAHPLYGTNVFFFKLCGLLCVLSTSMSADHSFSLAGRTLEDRRNMLAADSVDGLLFLHGV